MICFAIGVIAGTMIGIGVSWYLAPQEDGEQSDEYLRQYKVLKDRVEKAEHYAVVTRDHAGWLKLEVSDAMEDIIRILEGSNENKT